MELKERVIKVLDLLEEHYGPTKCYLTHENAWQLLIATILSAQCTGLFQKQGRQYNRLLPDALK